MLLLAVITIMIGIVGDLGTQDDNNGKGYDISTKAIPNEEWNKIYSCNIGGSEYCEAVAESVQQTTDGGYILVGNDLARMIGGNYYNEAWLRKTDSNGKLLWTKKFTEIFKQYFVYSFRQTKDGGYILAGALRTESPKDDDAAIIKTDSKGNKVWVKTFGGIVTDRDDGARSVQQTKDGGYIFAGYTKSSGAGGSDALLIKTDSNGNKLWSKAFGGTDDDSINQVQQTADGGYILAGKMYIPGKQYDAWLIKTDGSGNKLWSKTFGGSPTKDYEEAATSVQQTTDGGYILAGTTWAYGEVYGDAWTIKTDSKGNRVWSKVFSQGFNDDDYLYSVRQTSDGGYIFAGRSYAEYNSNSGAWLLKTDSKGNKLWSKIFGGDKALSVQQTKDGGYVFVGDRGSTAWIFKLSGEQGITVVSPNGGENWAKGSIHTIKWTKTGSTGSYVKIELLKGGVLNKVISSSTLNDGSYPWTISAIQIYGTDYKVRITSTSNSIYKDVSNNNFKIY